MRERLDILNDIILLKADVATLVQELSEYPWDIDRPLLKLRYEHLCNILNRFKFGAIDSAVLEDWANAIEVRSDLEFESEDLKQIIFELASPVLYGAITKSRLDELLIGCSNSQNQNE